MELHYEIDNVLRILSLFFALALIRIGVLIGAFSIYLVVYVLIIPPIMKTCQIKYLTRSRYIKIVSRQYLDTLDILSRRYLDTI